MALLKTTIVILSMLIYFSCKKNEEKIIIAIPEGPSTVSFIRMMENNSAVNGQSIEFVVKTDPTQLQAMMMQQKADFVVLPTVMAANMYNKGVDYRLLAIPVWGTLYIITRNPQLRTMEDLRGQEVHLFGQSGTADVLFRYYLKKNYIKDVGLNYSFTSNQELAMALLHKKISTAIISEPLVSHLLTKDSNLRIISQLTCEVIDKKNNTNTFAQSSFLANNKFIDSYPDLTRKISRMYQNSCAYTKSNPEESAKLMIKYGFYTDLKVAEESIKRCNIKYRKANELSQEIDSYLRIFYNFDPASIGGKMPDKNFIVQ